MRTMTDAELIADFQRTGIKYPPYFGPEASQHPEEMRQWARKVGVQYIERDTPR